MAVTIRRKSDTSVSVTFRFDQRLYFGLELLARKQHRSLNSQVEAAIAHLLNDPVNGLTVRGPNDTSQPKNILDEVWDFEEADRIVNLGMKFPALLGPDWERVWKTIRDDSKLWKNAQTPDIKEIRRRWDSIRSEQFQPKRIGRKEK